MAEKRNQTIYRGIIARIFEKHFNQGDREVPFDRSAIKEAAEELGVTVPENEGDLIYTFRFRASLPESILKTAGKGEAWVIRLAGRSKYKFALVNDRPIVPNPHLIETKILDSTPGLIARYALSDEQALLAKLRYNRLIDTFTGITCYSLQNHLRASVVGMGQVETDEIYVGVDKRGVHFVVPVQAKRGSDKIGIVQAEQDIALCAEKFPNLTCRPISAQFMKDDVIALFELALTDNGVGIVSERHYKLVAASDLSQDELMAYRDRGSND